jgi:hypothetical protein
LTPRDDISRPGRLARTMSFSGASSKS